MTVRIREKGTGRTLVHVDAASLKGASLAGQSLRGAQLKGRCLSGCILDGADLESADLRGADLRFASLVGTVLRGARLAHARLRGVALSGADLRDAELSGADLAWANLKMVLYDDRTRWPNPEVEGSTKFYGVRDSGAALSRLGWYARQHRLALYADLYHDVPVYELVWWGHRRRNTIQIAATDALEVTLRQSGLGRFVGWGRLEYSPWVHLRRDADWDGLHAVLEDARRHIALRVHLG